LFLFAVPLPYATIAQGVVWIPENAEIRAQTDGIVAGIVAPPDGAVASGQALVELGNPVLDSRVAVREAQRNELQERYVAARLADRVQAGILLEQINHIVSTLSLMRAIKASLIVKTEHDGRFVVPGATDLPGRFVKKGELL